MDFIFRFFLIGLLGVVAALGHELDVAVRLASPAVVLKASYGGTEPVPFAKVQVFSPADGKTEFQTGVTDKRGAFSFVPDGSGAWKVVIDDETGHRREVEVAVAPGFEAGGAGGPVAGGASRFERALLGVALLVGLTGFWYGWKARRK